MPNSKKPSCETSKHDVLLVLPQPLQSLLELGPNAPLLFLRRLLFVLVLPRTQALGRNKIIECVSLRDLRLGHLLRLF
jgi:hypothetical protein